ncbi:hypothetical protein [Luteimonas terrae]|uniref:Uncharacterized protein n=1 Tax=Luteimonas terrae TaxID=1530191 RepID=A0ABU1XV58_9GAMM|nr:hypothetical protein [Luteimonas terrae]MDR7192623.1 hypothetical protein [Luteimonas terrae]
MKALRIPLLVLAVFAVVWIAVIAYWRVRGVLPEGATMLLWLGFVPAVLAGLLLVARWRRRKRKQDTASRQEVASTAPAAEDHATKEDRVVHVMGAALRLPMASDAMDALAENAPRPGLHPRFRDREGLPVFAAFVQDLDTGSIEDALGQQEDGAGRRLASDDAFLRALALLEPVADALLVDIVATMPPIPQAVGTVNAGLQRRVTSAAPDLLQVSLLLPSSWHESFRASAGDWLLARAKEMGIDARQLRIDVHGVRVADDSWRFIEALAGAGEGSEGDRVWRLLLACDSLVDARGIARLDASGELLRSQRPEGMVPGEGACGIWIAPGSQDVGVPTVALHRICRGQASGELSMREATRDRASLMSQALDIAAISPDAVAWVISDADQHRRRSVQVVAATSEACPDLDIGLRYRALAALSGEIGIVMPLALLAVGAGAVAAAQAPLLAFSMGGERLRACVLSPAHSAVSVADTMSSST